MIKVKKRMIVLDLFDPTWQDTKYVLVLYVRMYWYFVTKIVLTYCEKNCSSDQEIFWKTRLKAENLQNFCNH